MDKVMNGVYVWIKLILMKMFGKKKLGRIEKEFPQVLSTRETIKKIKEGISIIRFGDGELALLLGKSIVYQEKDVLLKKRLRSILSKPKENILICLPEFNAKHNNTKNIIGDYNFWESYWFFNFDCIKKYIHKQIVYGNTSFSRVNVFMENPIQDIKDIWDQKEIVFVYSEKGRFNVEHELFSNILEYTEIFIPERNAYREYDRILTECLKQDKRKIFMVAAGPTATVLCYDLAMDGYQAIDIGHIINSYDQYLGKIKNPEALPISKV